MDETKELLTWLDEEQRRGKAELAELQRKAEEQSAHSQDLQKRFGELEGRLVQLSGQLARFPALDEILARVRGELTRALEEAEGERRRAQEEASLLRRRELEGLEKSLAALQEGLGAHGESLKALDFHTAELKRLSEAVGGLHKGISGLQEEVGEQTRKIRYLEERVDKTAKDVAGLGLLREEVRKERAEFLEEGRRLEEERRKEMREWRREMALWREEMLRQEEATHRLEERSEEATRLLASIRKLEEELRVRRDQLLHLQQVGEERLKKRLEEWRKENEKRWAEDEARWERRKGEEAQRDAHLFEVWQAQREYAQRQLKQMEEWLEWLEEHIKTL